LRPSCFGIESCYRDTRVGVSGRGAAALKPGSLHEITLDAALKRRSTRTDGYSDFVTYLDPLDFDGLQHNILVRLVLPSAGYRRDLVRDVLAFDNFSKDSVISR